jgi:hypothetical protein
VIRRVFARIIIFYILTVIIIGFNIPYDYPNLSTKSTATSPFTLIFAQAGSSEYLLVLRRGEPLTVCDPSEAGGSFMNAGSSSMLLRTNNPLSQHSSQSSSRRF